MMLLLFETLDMQPEDTVDTNLSINEGNGHDKKDKGVSEDVILANSHL